MPIEEISSPLNLRGVRLIVEQGLSQENVSLPDGEYTRSRLLQSLADQWIPLLECHKCGRFSYCKFAEPYPSNPHRGKEIQCGVVVTALDNLLLVSWAKLLTYDAEQLQNYFDGLFYFVQFVYDTEVTIGNYLSREYLDWAGEDLARKNFGFIAHLRVHLDKFASAFKLDFIHSQKVKEQSKLRSPPRECEAYSAHGLS